MCVFFCEIPHQNYNSEQREGRRGESYTLIKEMDRLVSEHKIRQIKFC